MTLSQRQQVVPTLVFRTRDPAVEKRMTGGNLQLLSDMVASMDGKFAIDPLTFDDDEELNAYEIDRAVQNWEKNEQQRALQAQSDPIDEIINDDIEIDEMDNDNKIV